MNSNFRPVYSSQQGKLCPDCGKPVPACSCVGKKSGNVAGDGIVRIRRESKGRGGKTVTVVSGLPLTGEPLMQLAKTLKQSCGTGGTVKDGKVEIQGDHVDRLMAELAKKGYRVKRAGG